MDTLERIAAADGAGDDAHWAAAVAAARLSRAQELELRALLELWHAQADPWLARRGGLLARQAELAGGGGACACGAGGGCRCGEEETAYLLHEARAPLAAFAALMLAIRCTGRLSPLARARAAHIQPAPPTMHARRSSGRRRISQPAALW